MTIGTIFYRFSAAGFSYSYLIFVMLFLTYCKLDLKNIQLSRLHLWLILIQILGSVAAFYSLQLVNPILAQGVMILMLVPTGTAALLSPACLWVMESPDCLQPVEQYEVVIAAR